MNVIARHVLVSGRVQGVYFRWETLRTAQELGLVGWVRNLADRRVEVWIEGDPDAVATLRAWLDHGPSGASVDAVESTEVTPADHNTFEVRNTSQRPQMHGT